VVIVIRSVIVFTVVVIVRVEIGVAHLPVLLPLLLLLDATQSHRPLVDPLLRLGEQGKQAVPRLVVQAHLVLVLTFGLQLLLFVSVALHVVYELWTKVSKGEPVIVVDARSLMAQPEAQPHGVLQGGPATAALDDRLWLWLLLSLAHRRCLLPFPSPLEQLSHHERQLDRHPLGTTSLLDCVRLLGGGGGEDRV
jgi:hypothetical protein